jgi:hypothetical protein
MERLVRYYPVNSKSSSNGGTEESHGKGITLPNIMADI